MEIGILIPLIIVTLILLFSDSRQRRALRQTETRLKRCPARKQQSTPTDRNSDKDELLVSYMAKQFRL